MNIHRRATELQAYSPRPIFHMPGFFLLLFYSTLSFFFALGGAFLELFWELGSRRGE